MIKDKLVITPQRLYSLVCLVHQLGTPSREELLDLLQPSCITDNRETATEIYRSARRYGLVQEDDSAAKRVSLQVYPGSITSVDAFRQHMQTILLGVTDESQDNFLLSQFTAWYATQDEAVLSFTKSDYEMRFNQTLYPDASTRVLAEQPGISAWRTWAEFLGWGWPLKFERREEMRIVPDATQRVRPMLPMLLPEAGVEVPMHIFMTNLAKRCPELDGGALFERCWSASHSGEVRGNRLSLMLSTALRVLHQNSIIEMVYRGDSALTWTLFPSQSHINRATHICRKVTA